LKNQLFLVNAGEENYILADGSINTLHYECKDAFGKPVKVKDVKKVTMV